MAKNEGLKKGELICTEDILLKVKNCYGVKETFSDSAVKKRIDRFLKLQIEDNIITIEKRIGNERYFKSEIMDLVLNDGEMRTYFANKFEKRRNYKTNYELLIEQKNELKSMKQEIYALWEKVGLSKEEGNYLEFDKFNEQRYLRADELEVLDKKGMVLKDTLTADELEKLEMYNRNMLQYEYETKKVEEVFLQKKMEIMITALFNRYFILDEETLRKDIENSVRYGKFDSTNLDVEYYLGKNVPSQDLYRSYLRLKENKYIHNKKE